MELSPSLVVQDLALIVAPNIQIYRLDEDHGADGEHIDGHGLAVVEVEEEGLHEVEEEHLHVDE